MADHQHDLLPAYAMDALSADERQAFEQHLAECRSCTEDLIIMRETLAGLADEYAVEPPAQLRAGVLDAVAQAPAPEPRQPSEPAPADRADEPFPDNPPIGRADETDGTVTPLRPRPQRPASRTGSRSRWQVLAAAAVALIAVIGIGIWQPWATRTVTAGDVLAAPDAVRAEGQASGGGSVTLVRSNQLGKAVLITHNLPATTGGKVMQAWLEHPGEHMVSAGVMPTGGNLTMLLEGDARNTIGAGITLEPAGGSTTPTLAALVVQLRL